MPNFNSLRRLEVASFGRFFSRFYGRHYWPLFRKLACELAEVTLEAHLKHSVTCRGNVTVVEGRFRANCLLYGLEIFVAEAVMKGITCIVHATTINPTTELVFRLIKALRADPQWKNGKCSYSHTVQISTREVLCRLFWSLHRRVFPEGCSCRRIPEVDYSIVHSNCMEKKIWKKRDERYLILTRLKW